ncbi:MAG: 16S rRNA (adenine(1518)-N(6)/adenine(1519)-N(6))-dimethyltransferase RsmA [Clostridiales bacterium]|nr:16S rRNA (adenine(1518)-N(6)/adenine(1519)-N(6))-dimethyltransferase RsmA [Clostridiales bacterium]
MEDLKEILSRHGFGFKKQFGQNFLTDTNLLRAIVKDAGAEGRNVLEIGAGAGALTRELAAVANKVVAYEIDKSLQPVLGETLRGAENCEVVFRDFLKSDLKEIEKELKEYIVVANLPYYVTTPVVMRFIEEAKGCRGLTVMVQEEVAMRLTAKAGTGDYGAVTAAVARRGECEITRRVPRSMFTPRPNVDSAVVKIIFTDGIPVLSEAAYRQTVRCAFASRRKTLENNLMNAFRVSRETAKEVLHEAEVEDGVRGETLSPERLAHLSDVLFERGLIK